MDNERPRVNVRALKRHSEECGEILLELKDALDRDQELTADVRRLMTSHALLDDFNQPAAADCELAGRLLNASLAALVDNHTLLAIHERLRRIESELN